MMGRAGSGSTSLSWAAPASEEEWAFEVFHACSFGFQSFEHAAGAGTALRAAQHTQPAGTSGRCPAQGSSSRSRRQTSSLKGWCCGQRGLAGRGWTRRGCEGKLEVLKPTRVHRPFLPHQPLSPAPKQSRVALAPGPALLGGGCCKYLSYDLSLAWQQCCPASRGWVQGSCP